MNVVAILLSTLLIVPPAALAQGFDRQENIGTREYFSSNPSGRIMIKVHVWGDVPSGGIYHVPDTTSLTQMIGYVGGPKGDVDDSKVFLRRKPEEEKFSHYHLLEYSGRELLSDVKPANLLLENGDVIYVESFDSKKNFVENMTIVGTVTGIVASLLITVFLIQDRK